MRRSPLRRSRRLTVVERAVLSSSALLALTLVLLIVTPVTISAPIRIGELVVLAAVFLVLLAINVVAVRRILSPLTRFAAALREVDLADGRVVTIGGANQAPELAALADAFNEMLTRLRRERRAGARAALLAQERERLRIAQALHDEAGQTLTAVALEIERAAADGSATDRARLAAIATELHKTLDEVRRISRELRPEALDDLGLVNALIALSTRVSKQGGVRVERDLTRAPTPLAEDVELVIYRVAQEAMTNVLRHADASGCLIRLAGDRSSVKLEVADDGIGMPAAAGGETIGIQGMRERALLVGGRLSVGSGPEGGTAVVLEVPLEGD